MTSTQRAVLLKLADLCERYDVTFGYTTDDDGTHIEVAGIEVFAGHIHLETVVAQLRAAAWRA